MSNPAESRSWSGVAPFLLVLVNCAALASAFYFSYQSIRIAADANQIAQDSLASSQDRFEVAKAMLLPKIKVNSRASFAYPDNGGASVMFTIMNVGPTTAQIHNIECSFESADGKAFGSTRNLNTNEQGLSLSPQSSYDLQATFPLQVLVDGESKQLGELFTEVGSSFRIAYTLRCLEFPSWQESMTAHVQLISMETIDEK
ncbi:MAG: hypothetical protein AAGI54_04340 [Planctomycetota bacterium]